FLTRKPYGKPMMVNEYGVGRNRLALEYNLHAGIWASALSPMFGPALFWWWPFIDHFNLYFHYRALANFLQGEDQRGKNLQLSTATVEVQPDQGTSSLEVTGIQNRELAYLWVYDTKYFNTGSPKEKVENAPKAKVRINYLLPGNYRVEFWDTYEGKVIDSMRISHQSGSFLVTLPFFKRDLAIKVKTEAP
ncbi:MAG: hypothetical protein NC911_08820, partial [Candidatus Omnitrophica bacterium]|nr:hypothetical protein [Candidatus Omnitrophota bacterium]